MKKTIAVIRGDGIGPEIVGEALRVLDTVAEKFGHLFSYVDVDMGGCAIDKWGDRCRRKCLIAALRRTAFCSAPWAAKNGTEYRSMRPEKGLLRLRAGMGVYSNNRPAKIWRQLASASPLKKEIVDKGIDFIIVRELIGGIYFGKHETTDCGNEKVALDELKYSEKEIERIGRIGFETARKRRGKLCSVEKKQRAGFQQALEGGHAPAGRRISGRNPYRYAGR